MFRSYSLLLYISFFLLILNFCDGSNYFKKCAVCNKAISLKEHKNSRPAKPYANKFKLTDELADDARICGACRYSALSTSSNQLSKVSITVFFIISTKKNIKTYLSCPKQRVGKCKRKVGRPSASRRTQPIKEPMTKNEHCQTEENVIALQNWQVQETCFGEILRGPCGSVIFPPGLFDEVQDEMNHLSKSKPIPQ